MLLDRFRNNVRGMRPYRTIGILRYGIRCTIATIPSVTIDGALKHLFGFEASFAIRRANALHVPEIQVRRTPMLAQFLSPEPSIRADRFHDNS